METKEIYDLVKTNSSTTLRVMQLAVWGPVGNALFFVYANNIYYKTNVTTDEVIQLTTDGVFTVLYNGVPDWVYEGKTL